MALFPYKESGHIFLILYYPCKDIDIGIGISTIQSLAAIFWTMPPFIKGMSNEDNHWSKCSSPAGDQLVLQAVSTYTQLCDWEILLYAKSSRSSTTPKPPPNPPGTAVPDITHGQVGRCFCNKPIIIHSLSHTHTLHCVNEAFQSSPSFPRTLHAYIGGDWGGMIYIHRLSPLANF